MLKHYFTTAWRHLLKHRRFTLLNLLGLTAGVTCALLICLWIYDELEMDEFHEKHNRIFQVMENLPHDNGIRTVPETPAPLAESLAASMPEVETSAVSTPPSWFRKVALTAGNTNSRGTGLFVGKNYLDVFSYPLLMGNKQQVLTGNKNIVLSEKLARTLFRTVENSIGKTVAWQIDSLKRQAIVAGVMKDVPAGSSVRFDFLLPFSVFEEDIMKTQFSLNGPGPFLTYLVLKEGTDTSRFNTKLRSFMRSKSDGNPRDLFVARYADNYLHEHYQNGVQAGGRIGYVKLFALIAFFIIAIACINFMNLATAEASGRMKEVGIRKTVGAGRGMLVLQYLGESVLLSFLALVFALLIVALLLPQFNAITGKQLTMRAMNIPLLLSFGGIALLTGCLAGSYPAFYLSGFNPIAVLKGKLQDTAGGLWIRKGLVVFQFAISVIFIVAVLVVYRQLAFVLSQRMGYDKDHVIYFVAEGKVPANIDAFINGIKQIPGVDNASSMVGNVLGAPSVNITWNNKGKNDVLLCRPFLLYYDMMETLGIQLAAGRSFSRRFSTDTGKLIFNEAAIKAMGIQNPVGKVIDFGGWNSEIIGVVKDFHFQSLHEPVKPLFFRLDPGGTVMVKIKPGMEHTVIDRLSRFYQAYNPGFSFEYRFLDEDYQLQYQAEKRVAALSKYFAALAVIISCLGLLGLSAYTAERRSREIGIRKVLGATVGNIVLMLSAEFIRFVLIAVCIATPLAWWIMHNWLRGFAYHINLGAGVFVITGLFMLFITLCTVSFRAIKAAVVNPVVSLKSE